MIISISGIQQFRKCQRQWGFKTYGESRCEEESFRRELFLLSKLQSLWAWRGNLVDYTISKRVVTAINNGWPINENLVLGFAREIFEKQLAFAKSNKLRDYGMKPSAAGDSFAALAEVDYDGNLKDEDVEKAWKDVENAISNLFRMTDLLDLLRSADHVITQRALSFEHFGLTFRAFPDLIAFFQDRRPLIVDWKVHWRATADYRIQLAAYAIALSRSEPHRDFPESLKKYKSAEFQLIEAQLLTGVQREHFLSEEDIIETEDFITSGALEISLSVDGKLNKELDPYDFPITSNPDHCEVCNFRKVCMEEAKCRQPRQMSLLY